MSQVRADLLDIIATRCLRDGSVSLDQVMDEFFALHGLGQTTAKDALDDLKHLGLIEMTVERVTLSSLTKRLVS